MRIEDFDDIAIEISNQYRDKYKFKSLDDIITFGKYKGNKLSYVMRMDKKYFEWMKENIKDFEYPKIDISESSDAISYVMDHMVDDYIYGGEDFI